MKKKPKVIILENDETVSNHIEAVLTKEGWDVTCEKASKEALHYLAASKKVLFALFISNFKLPKMQGDDVLSQVKSISPLTQRMLITPADKPETLIKAINKADIHACVISPFKEEVLINQAGNCLKQFKYALKREQLKRVTNHQNKQMFNIARKLKKKTKAYKQLIDEKKTKRNILESKKKKLQDQASTDTDITLESFLKYKKTVLEPEPYHKEFLILCDRIETVFYQLTDELELSPLEIDLQSILKTSSTEKQPDENEIKPETKAEKPDKSGRLPIKKAHADIVSRILETVLKNTVHGSQETSKESEEPENTEEITTEHPLDEYFKVSVSGSKTQAFIKKIKGPEESSPAFTATDILDLLMQKEIAYGLLNDAAIEIWLAKSEEDKICIAKGEDPIEGEDGVIKFHFQTDYTKSGKINEDGTIDFRERGEIPYITEGKLLAEKTFPVHGKSGISISGTPIPVKEALDPAFDAGPGTRISEEGTHIYADTDGQPHLDKLGTISVSPELVIPGDVDYETGNIDFKGNITVKGMIKEGFTVKGINLTVQEVEGGNIDLSGDLNVSSGVTDSTIRVHGNIQAKFINHSKVMGFGDLTVSKEIIDSKIILSGKCINTTGHIISSQITAKLGIDAGSIGTASSTPVKLKVGVEEHIEILDKQIDEDLKLSVTQINALRDEIKTLEEKDHKLYELISEKAHVQDRAQVEINQIRHSMKEVEKSNNLSQLQQLSNKIKRLTETARTAEKELNDIFDSQDQIAKEIDSHKKRIKRLERKNKKLVLDKKALKEFSMKNKPVPSVWVGKTIAQDTLVKSAHSSKFLKEDQTHCKLVELTRDENGIVFHEITITDL